MKMAGSTEKTLLSETAAAKLSSHAAKQESFLLKAAIAGTSCAVVAAVLNPLDVTRIRLQLQAASGTIALQYGEAGIPSSTGLYTGMLQGVRKIWKEEGIRGWSRGNYFSHFVAAVLHGTCFLG